MKAIAYSNGGRCLSNKYAGIKSPLKWECKNGHIWTAAPQSILSKRDKSWCRICAKHPIITIYDAIKLAESKGGKFLSNSYKNRKEVYSWQCKYGHIWETSYSSIKYGDHWCPICSNCAKLSIEILEQTAQKFGGHCLSTIYTNVESYYTWQCSKGHTWEALAQNVRWGYWCPYCVERKSEALCRSLLEEWFGYKFVKIKPKWLRNPKTGAVLELDGYCIELNIAFEYNGEQHYEPVNFGGNIKDVKFRFKEQKIRDFYKKNLCKQNKTSLIIIEPLERINKDKIKEKIFKQLEKKFPKTKNKKKVKVK